MKTVQPNTVAQQTALGSQHGLYKQPFSDGLCLCISVTRLRTYCHAKIIFLHRRIDTGSGSGFSSIRLSLSPEASRVAHGAWCCGANASPWWEISKLGRNESKQSSSLCYTNTRKMLIQLSLFYTLLITTAFVNICLMVLYLCGGFGSSSDKHFCRSCLWLLFL